MIEGLAHAARVFARDDWLATARRALALLRLGRQLNEPRYLDAAQRVLGAFGAQLGQQPAGCAALVMGLEAARAVNPPACDGVLRASLPAAIG